MEQKTKKYSELNKYERAMTNASLEQRLEAMARDLQQISLALGMSIHIDAFSFGEDRSGVDVNFFPYDGECLIHTLTEDGDLFGAIEEAMNKKNPSD